MKLDLPAPLSPRMHVTSPAFTCAETSLQRDDVAVVLRDLVGLEQVASRHLAFCARVRTSVLSITAAKRIAPWNVYVQLLSHCASMIPSWTIPSIAAPKNAPITDP